MPEGKNQQLLYWLGGWPVTGRCSRLTDPVLPGVPPKVDSLILIWGQHNRASVGGGSLTQGSLGRSRGAAVWSTRNSSRAGLRGAQGSCEAGGSGGGHTRGGSDHEAIRASPAQTARLEKSRIAESCQEGL